MKTMKYRAATSENFYYIEAKRLASVMSINKEFSKEELEAYIRELDILETNTDNNFRKKFTSIYRRLTSLNEILIERLIEEPADIGKFINLLSIVLNDKILFDFLNEVLREKYFLMDKSIMNDEFNSFMSGKIDQEEKIAKWSEASRKKIIVKIKAYLVETGYLVKKSLKSKEFNISKPLIPMDILSIIKNYYGEKILKALLLEM